MSQGTESRAAGAEKSNQVDLLCIRSLPRSSGSKLGWGQGRHHQSRENQGTGTGDKTTLRDSGVLYGSLRTLTRSIQPAQQPVQHIQEWVRTAPHLPTQFYFLECQSDGVDASGLFTYNTCGVGSQEVGRRDLGSIRKPTVQGVLGDKARGSQNKYWTFTLKPCAAGAVAVVMGKPRGLNIYTFWLFPPTCCMLSLCWKLSICSFIHSLTFFFLKCVCSFGKRGWEGWGGQLKLSQDSLPSQRKEIKPQMESQGRESADWFPNLLLTVLFFFFLFWDNFRLIKILQRQ